jgi:hypothetical protein
MLEQAEALLARIRQQALETTDPTMFTDNLNDDDDDDSLFPPGESHVGLVDDSKDTEADETGARKSSSGRTFAARPPVDSTSGHDSSPSAGRTAARRASGAQARISAPGMAAPGTAGVAGAGSGSQCPHCQKDFSPSLLKEHTQLCALIQQRRPADRVLLSRERILPAVGASRVPMGRENSNIGAKVTAVDNVQTAYV